MRYLQRARALDPSQALRVAIAPDTYIRAKKGREPFWTQADRAATVFALDCVTDVILQQEDTPAALIRRLHPRWFVKGLDWKGLLPIEVLAACQEAETEIRYVEAPGRHVGQARC